MPSSRDISALHPNLQPLCRRWMSECEAAGLKAFLIFTWRSVADQNALYAAGRTVKSHVGPWTPKKPLGSIVTHARGGQSPHNFTLGLKPASKAFDFGVMKDGKYLTDGAAPEYEQAGEIGEALGLVWGGRWKKPKTDYSHLELKNG